MMKNKLVFFLFFSLFFLACEKEPVPKPKGYFRISLPEKKYEKFQAKCGFSFQKPTYSKAVYFRGKGMDSCWFNLVVPRLNAKFHMTYLPIDNNLQKYVEEAYVMAYKHEVKASTIKTTPYYDKERKVSGLIYDLGGDVASSLQFYMTDSVNHFLRGALYFENHPNADSLAPVLSFLREDMDMMYQTIEWN